MMQAALSVALLLLRHWAGEMGAELEGEKGRSC